MRGSAGGVRISIDPNGVSRIWPGHISAYRPPGVVLSLGQEVTVVQEEDDEPDYVGRARVIGLRGRFVGLDVDWASFREEATTRSDSAGSELSAAAGADSSMSNARVDWRNNGLLLQKDEHDRFFGMAHHPSRGAVGADADWERFTRVLTSAGHPVVPTGWGTAEEVATLLLVFFTPTPGATARTAPEWIIGASETVAT